MTPTAVTTPLAGARGAGADVRALVAFRVSGLRGRRRAVGVGGAAVLMLTGAAAVVPAYLHGAGVSRRATDSVLLLPTAYLAFLCITAFAIIVAGGGRELLSRDEAVAFPVSPTTDHLGALILAPVNVAWMVQSWGLLGFTAYASGPQNLWAVQLTTLVWLFFATTLAQAVAWLVEGARRRRRGTWVVRGLGALLALSTGILVAAHQVTKVLDHSPTLYAVMVALDGRQVQWRWAIGTAVLGAVGLLATGLGAVAAHGVARRPPREELRAEGRPVTPRDGARTEYAALLRIDRSSVLRSVPLRRGFLILALTPGLVAAAGQLQWQMLPLLPGLVASGAALLFGVNAWALDGVGARWRDSLPVAPALVFAARARVLGEVLLVATALTLAVAGLRAGGLPSAPEATALLASAVVVPLQVVTRSMHWSARKPFPADLKSARGTPAPPLTMVGYSSYLAVTSTLTGTVFVVAARATDPRLSLVLAAPFLLAAVRRLLITRREWSTLEVRASVVATVSAR